MIHSARPPCSVKANATSTSACRAASRPFDALPTQPPGTWLVLGLLTPAALEAADSSEELDSLRRAIQERRERVAEYERVRRVGEQIRDATSLAAQSEARLREIRDEQSFRGPEGWELHLKRLTSI